MAFILHGGVPASFKHLGVSVRGTCSTAFFLRAPGQCVAAQRVRSNLVR